MRYLWLLIKFQNLVSWIKSIKALSGYNFWLLPRNEALRVNLGTDRSFFDERRLHPLLFWLTKPLISIYFLGCDNIILVHIDITCSAYLGKHITKFWGVVIDMLDTLLRSHYLFVLQELSGKLRFWKVLLLFIIHNGRFPLVRCWKYRTFLCLYIFWSKPSSILSSRTTLITIIIRLRLLLLRVIRHPLPRSMPAELPWAGPIIGPHLVHIHFLLDLLIILLYLFLQLFMARILTLSLAHPLLGIPVGP